MPVLSSFCGITVAMYLDNRRHSRPCIHARFHDSEDVVAIPEGDVLEGGLPPGKMHPVSAWRESIKPNGLPRGGFQLKARNLLEFARWRRHESTRKFSDFNPDLRLYLRFTIGEEGVCDCAPLLEHGVFSELKDPEYFVRASVEGGTVVWPNEQDICPDTLYEDSTKLQKTNA